MRKSWGGGEFICSGTRGMDGKNRTGHGGRANNSGDHRSRLLTHTQTSLCVCSCLCGCRVNGCTRPAPSTATKARGTIGVTVWGVVLWLCACDGLWWVLCQWLSHRAHAVKAPVRFPLPSWPHCRREGARNAQLPRATNGASRGAHCCKGRWCVLFHCRGGGGLVG